jgi:hypothetical protein
MITKLKPAVISAPAGGGSGGEVDDGNEQHSVAGIYTVTATSVEIVSRTPSQTLRVPTDPPPRNVITLLATGAPPDGAPPDGAGTGGYVEVRGNTGVRITAGPPPLLETSSDDTNGVEIFVGETQSIIFERGILPSSIQVISMAPDGIEIKHSSPGLDPSKTETITMEDPGITMIVGDDQDITIQRGLLPSSLQKITMKPDGIMMQSGEEQDITIQRGLLPSSLQTIIMKPDGIMMQSGLSTITLQMDGVFIKSGATSTIIVNDEGVTIQGPMVKIN